MIKMIVLNEGFIDLEESISDSLIHKISEYISSRYIERDFSALELQTMQHMSIDLILDLNNQEFKFLSDLIEDENINLDFCIRIRLNVKVTKNLDMNTSRIREKIKEYNESYTDNLMKNEIYGVLYRDLSNKAKSQFLVPMIEKL